jgi:hypothetical protein
MSNVQAITLVQLNCVTGGADAKPAAPTTPAPQQPAPQPAPTGGGNDTQWIKNTINCTRIGGPVLGAICGIMTPSPAY